MNIEIIKVEVISEDNDTETLRYTALCKYNNKTYYQEFDIIDIDEIGDAILKLIFDEELFKELKEK